MSKFDTKLCPNCQMPIKIKNFKASIKKCNECKNIICNHCSIFNLCLDCHVKTTKIRQVDNYFIEKYGVMT